MCPRSRCTGCTEKGTSSSGPSKEGERSEIVPGNDGVAATVGMIFGASVGSTMVIIGRSSAGSSGSTFLGASGRANVPDGLESVSLQGSTPNDHEPRRYQWQNWGADGGTVTQRYTLRGIEGAKMGTELQYRRSNWRRG